MIRLLLRTALFVTIPPMGRVLGLEIESVEVSMCARSSTGSLTTLTWAAVMVVFSADRRRVDISEVCSDYVEYRSLNVNPEPKSYIDSDASFDQDLLCTQAGNALELSEKMLGATMASVKRLDYAVPVSKKCYVELVYLLAGELKEVRRKSEVDWSELAEREGKIEEFSLKLQLLRDD